MESTNTAKRLAYNNKTRQDDVESRRSKEESRLACVFRHSSNVARIHNGIYEHLHAIVNETRQQDKTTFKQAIFHRFLVKEVVVMRPRLVVGGDLVKVMMEVVVPRQRLEQHRLSSNYT